MSEAPVPAATVILLRDGPAGPEVLLLERHAGSGVLPDMYVFPGGRVEEADRGLLEHTGSLLPDDPDLALPTVDPVWAAGYLGAAIRETFEEAGILLARARKSGEAIDPGQALLLGRLRLDLQSGRLHFGDLLLEHDLALDARALAVHGHWITPEVVKRRFDTVFFSALAPAGQMATHDGVESSSHLWIRPEEALAQAAAGTRSIVFPTLCNLETLCGFERARDVWESSRARPVVTVVPRVEDREGQRVFVIPEEAGYPSRPPGMPDPLP